MAPKSDTRRRGPDPERLKIDADDWTEAVKKALRKKKPKEGWPDREPGDQEPDDNADDD